MSKQSTMRKYGKQQKKAKAERLFAELPQTPLRAPMVAKEVQGQNQEDEIAELTAKVGVIDIEDENDIPEAAAEATPAQSVTRRRRQLPLPESIEARTPKPVNLVDAYHETSQISILEDSLRNLSWSELCPPSDKIVKIAEASYAEVYRVMNERGTSIIKVIRMESPIKPQTKTQQKSGLVDEMPHSESDLIGELKISEWLADIPGFVVYKERYIVQGKACRELLETHQAFHKRAKRKDPDRLQFYPSPSRYLDDTKFLVVELGDAGIALEDFALKSIEQVWDIFFHVAIALARAEVQVEFEHRDLHEGNLCIRQVGEYIPLEERQTCSAFGHSGLEITILDYGLSRARGDAAKEKSAPIAYDLERDLSLFASEHAPQCRVYRQMRSFMLRGDRICIPPENHKVAYADGVEDPISWARHEPYTNVLWLAYIYDYLVNNFRGPKKDLNTFRRVTKDFWLHMNPDADDSIPSFASASDIIMFTMQSGWVEEEQLTGGRSEIEKSIISILSNDSFSRDLDDPESSSAALRRSPRRRAPQRLA
ncbi:hypothetical protein BX600DRAFT_79147 [Xylariales sp. PMI_506]|nr:hypothetical protein BX600DRAFT_79147 [Xylariales sp. PMI_506]